MQQTAVRPAAARTAAPRSVWVLTAAMAAAALLAWREVGLGAGVVKAPLQLPWPMLFVAFAVAELLLVHFEVRKQTHALTLGEVPLLVGLVFCSPMGLLAARLLGSLVALVGWFRQSSVKLCFNLSMHAAKVVAALWVYRAVLDGTSPVGARGWLAAFAATFTADVVSHLAIAFVITLTAGRSSTSTLQTVAVACAVVAVTNTSLALLTVVVLWYDAPAVGLLVVMALVFAVGYRAHTGMRRRYSNLELLYRFTDAIGGTASTPVVIETVLGQAMELLGAQGASLVVCHPGETKRYSLSDRGVLRVGEASLDELEQVVLTSGHGQLLPAGDRAPGSHTSLSISSGARDAVAAPINLSGGVHGVLVVSDRASDIATFELADLRLLEALANHAAVALRGSQLLAELRDEVAASEHQALHDSLTGLANRDLFYQKAAEALERSSSMAVMLMDLDRFKEINDTLGHHTGDRVLQQIAARLVRTVGPHGSVARLGGDEFAIVLADGGGSSSAVRWAERLRVAAQETLDVDGLQLEIQASVGIALAHEHGNDPATLLQRADVAMYDAKSGPSGIAMYCQAKDNYSPRRLTLANELRSAIGSGDLSLHYQPQVALATGEVFGVEALLRWNHPSYGFIPPDEFIPVAENCSLIGPLTSWVLATALAQVAEWRRGGLDLSVAVNFSPRSMMDAALIGEITDALVTTGVGADRLVIELTETSIMTDLAASQHVLHALAATGASLSIDDFGTGYSSLSRLARLPVSEVKIDRTFVAAMTTDHSSEVIVRSTIDLARNLGLRVVAEGVEDEQTWAALERHRCEAIQGFVLTRPVPALELESWLAARRARRCDRAGIAGDRAPVERVGS